MDWCFVSATKYYIWTIALSEWTGPGDPYTPFRIWYTPKLTNHDALWLLNATILSLLDQGVINYLVTLIQLKKTLYTVISFSGRKPASMLTCTSVSIIVNFENPGYHLALFWWILIFCCQKVHVVRICHVPVKFSFFMYNSEVLNIWQWRNYISDLAGELTFGPQHWTPPPHNFKSLFKHLWC